MHGTSILLIDFENFFLGRESLYLRANPGDAYSAVDDIESLLEFAIDLARPRRLIVRRAYANFNVRRLNGSAARTWDYYLAAQPQRMMELGIEPVHVFRLPGGGNKNAADMRLAMDATALVESDSGVEQVIIVSGDGDFIPVILQLRSRGAEVVGVGVKESTKKVVEKYFDRFEYFEELAEAREIETESVTHLAPIRDVLHRLMADRNPPSIKFAAVKPLLAKTLGQFDPRRFDCDNTGEFLRQYESELQIQTRQGEFDWEIAPQGKADGVVVMPGATERLAGASKRAPVRTVADYRRWLRARYLFIQPIPDWRRVTQLVIETAIGEGTPRPHLDAATLRQDITEQCDREGMDDAAKRVNGCLHQMFKAGCFVWADDPDRGKPLSNPTSRAMQLAPEIASVDALNERVHRYLLRLLIQKFGTVQAELFAQLVFGPDKTPEQIAYIETLIETNENATAK